MNEAGPWGKGATEGTGGWEGAGRQDSGDTLGGHRVLTQWMEVKRQRGALSENELQGERGVTFRLEVPSQSGQFGTFHLEVWEC